MTFYSLPVDRCEHFHACPGWFSACPYPVGLDLGTDPSFAFIVNADVSA